VARRQLDTHLQTREKQQSAAYKKERKTKISISDIEHHPAIDIRKNILISS
jgi:hypothetical protein